MDISVVANEASESLATGIATRLGANMVRANTKIFPDGESKITLDTTALSNDTTVIVQPTSPPVDTNLMRALSLIATVAKRSTDVIAVIPYMGYARQDKEFLDGEVITMDVLGKLFDCAGASKIITVDIHSRVGLEYLKKGQNVSAIPELARYFKNINLNDPIVVSPDQGGKDRAEKFANNIKAPWIALKKSRDKKTGKIQIDGNDFIGNSNTKDRDVILVDDMISTGGSIVKAAQVLKNNGCQKMYVACTHALMINGAREKIFQTGVSKIVSTNTIPSVITDSRMSSSTTTVDISNIIVNAIAHIKA